MPEFLILVTLSGFKIPFGFFSKSFWNLSCAWGLQQHQPLSNGGGGGAHRCLLLMLIDAIFKPAVIKENVYFFEDLIMQTFGMCLLFFPLHFQKVWMEKKWNKNNLRLKKTLYCCLYLFLSQSIRANAVKLQKNVLLWWYCCKPKYSWSDSKEENTFACFLHPFCSATLMQRLHPSCSDVETLTAVVS